MQQR
ncbi:hypothetical protein Nmel_003437 [Mimus melanotis]|jgi:hypothetical protein